MTSELLYALLPSHVLLAALIVLMGLETLRADPRWARPVAVLACAAGLAIVWQQIAAGYGAGAGVAIVAGEVAVDRYALWSKLVLLACGLMLACSFFGQGSYKFWMLALSSLLGGLVIMDSAGFATLFIGIELLSLPAFAAMIENRGGTVAIEGAFKYLVLSSVATALLLFGVALAYGSTGTLAIAPFMQSLVVGGTQAKAAGLLVLGGLFLKAAVFPLHAWAPDAYACARLQVTAMMASMVKAAVVLALARIVAGVALDATSVRVIVVLALASIYYGNIAALAQPRFKRLLAYSSIAHAGYMIIALADTTGTRAEDLLWYAGIYALTSLLACACFAVLCPGDDDKSDELQALEGRFSSHPIAALGLSFAALSLAGMPPFPGFFAKLFIFKSVVASGHLVAAVVAFVGSFLGLAYYLGIVVRLFRGGAVSGAGTQPLQEVQR